MIRRDETATDQAAEHQPGTWKGGEGITSAAAADHSPGERAASPEALEPRTVEAEAAAEEEPPQISEVGAKPKSKKQAQRQPREGKKGGNERSKAGKSGPQTAKGEGDLDGRASDGQSSSTGEAGEGGRHLHFFVVPELKADGRLDLDEIHPGRRMKLAAAEAGASKKAQDAAYRRGMERWQDEFHYDVSRHFGHERYLPKRARVTRQERQAQKRVEKEAARRRAELELAQAEFEAEMAARRSELALAAAELERSAAQTRAEIAHQREMLERRKAETEAELGRKQAKMIEVARGNAWRAFGQPLQEMRAAHKELKERCRVAEAEAERLQARLDELEPDLSWRAVA